ncbi:hypothetical protein [Sphingopyxis sp.]|uniref:hypothetical protein n=1 Tax=Sphingopyxis sp. TaxID=1908224 RepID=UPI0035B288F2
MDRLKKSPKRNSAFVDRDGAVTVARIVAWVIAATAGIGVGLSSYAISNETRAPRRTLALGVLPVGTAKANLALDSFAARRARDPRVSVSARELRWAREAYQSEPLAASAVALQALQLTGKADSERRWALLEAAGKLTRRNSLTNIMLIETAARRNDQRSFFTWISRTMLTGSSAGQAYATAMADATARDGAVKALIDVLGPNPRWSDLYWQLINGRPASFTNAAKLRIALTKKPWNQTAIKQNDGDLVQGLAGAGKFDEAWELADALRPRMASKGNVLADGSFTGAPLLAPFDWQLSTLGNLGALIDRRQKQLVISAVGGASGPAARQLVRLMPGTYRFAWSMASNAPVTDGALSFQIRCAEANVPSATEVSIPLVAGKRYVDVKVADGACRWHWASIDVALPDDAMGVDAMLSSLSLAAVS